MVKKSFDVDQSKLGIVTLDSNIPSDHISRFVVDFVEEVYDDLGIVEDAKKTGRASFPVKSMLKLLVYSTIDHITSSRVIGDMVRFHDVYKYVCDGLCPSARTIRRYREKYGLYYEELLKQTLKKAHDWKITDFNHVCIDGTIKKAYNSSNNVIGKKEVQLLIRHFNGVEMSKEEQKKLHKPARKILKRKMKTSDKLELLYDIETQFTLTGQNTIPVNDIEARWMKNKKGNMEISYNLQCAFDYDSKLICALTVVSRPTDHYELPGIADKAIENIKTTPKHMSADTIYLNQISLTYFEENGINGLIPTRKQSKQKINKLNKNKFHKDHFTYIHEKDAFLCPNNQYMHFQKEYKEHDNDKKIKTKVKRLYSNYTACKNCKFKNECMPSKTTHRTITEYGDQLKKAMELKMEEPGYKEEYQKRGGVESGIGVIKTQYHVEQQIVVGQKETEERLTLNAVAYNLKRLYNIKYQKSNKKEDIEDFCESISAENQLELNVTIF